MELTTQLELFLWCVFNNNFVFVYVFGTELQVSQTFWATWKELEIKHGNEDTLREMLRIRRSVQATYNIQVTYWFVQTVQHTRSFALGVYYVKNRLNILIRVI